MFDRTIQFERKALDTGNTGQVSGVLATDGEASDGHILNMAGGELRTGLPLLFNHDPYDGNLGSWVSFDEGKHAIRGTAQIEMDGIGDRSEWRKDVAHMVGKGHIGAFSIRWDESSPPMRRTDLDPKHPAYVDKDHEQNLMKLYGLYFDDWRMIEGSVVSTPADEAALIGRMRSAGHGARQHWVRVIERMAGCTPTPEGEPNPIIEAFRSINLDELERIELSDGRDYYVPLEVIQRMQEVRPEIVTECVMRSEENCEGVTPAATHCATGVANLERADLFDLIREELAPAYQLMRKEWRELLFNALGRI